MPGPLSFWLDRWYAELPEISATVGRVVALGMRDGDGSRAVQELELDPAQGVVGDPRGPLVHVVRADVLRALAEDPGADLLPSGDHLYLELDLAAAGLPAGSALTIGTAILGVRDGRHAPDAGFRAAFGGRAARRIRRHNRTGGGGRRLACPVLQGGTVKVGDRVYAKAIGIRFQP